VSNKDLKVTGYIKFVRESIVLDDINTSENAPWCFDPRCFDTRVFAFQYFKALSQHGGFFADFL
jgi:hypothetical protein